MAPEAVTSTVAGSTVARPFIFCSKALTMVSVLTWPFSASFSAAKYRMIPEMEFSNGRAICMLVFSGFTHTSMPVTFWMSPVTRPIRRSSWSLIRHS
jgi:hypothetical protein